MKTLDSKFMEMRFVNFPHNRKIKGFWVITRIQKTSMYLKLCWELITTFIVYSPSVNNYLKEMIPSIRDNWDDLSETEQESVIAALTVLNKHGEIEKALSKY